MALPDSHKYKKYEYLQKVTYGSLESTNRAWTAGQKRCIDLLFPEMRRDTRIADIACGDGVGLRHLKHLGFTNVTGIEFSEIKYRRARKVGFPVHQCDMHDLHVIEDQSFDIVYSSHTVEHALYPVKALKEFYRLLSDKGLFFLILPYPDIWRMSKEAHIGREVLGTNKADYGKTLIKLLEKVGFKLVDTYYDTFRQPEIWLVLCKNKKKHMPYTSFFKKTDDPRYIKPFYMPLSYLRRSFFFR